MAQAQLALPWAHSAGAGEPRALRLRPLRRAVARGPAPQLRWSWGALDGDPPDLVVEPRPRRAARATKAKRSSKPPSRRAPPAKRVRQRVRMPASWDAVYACEDPRWQRWSEPVVKLLRRRRAGMKTRDICFWALDEGLRVNPTEILAWLELKGVVAWARGRWRLLR